MTTRDHYETLLAEHYSWMFGVPFALKVAEQRRLLEQLDALPTSRGLALDLGCGSGFQSVALAELGFGRVVAVDLSPTLLAELDRRKGDHPIETVEADLVAHLAGVARGSTDLVSCMGDTLTHLGDRDQVRALFAAAVTALAPGGLLAITYRDLTPALAGTDRLIQVAGDADRILTCFLEYFPLHVTVHDILHERAGEGWRMRASAYDKLRLPAHWVEQALRAAGLARIETTAAGRLTAVVARMG